MDTVKSRRTSDTWERRKVKLLSVLAELGGEAPKDNVLQQLSTTSEYTTKGPQEPKLKSPEHYFKFVVTDLTSGAKKFVQLRDGILRLTDKGREHIGAAKVEPSMVEVRTVDTKSRLLLPKEFASATVTLERVSENEIRIRKAVVVPADELPLIEDQLKPLSDRDRDLFLSLLDNPPEPTPGLVKALKLHKKRHG